MKKLTTKQCRSLLALPAKKEVSDDDVEKLRDDLYVVADLVLDVAEDLGSDTIYQLLLGQRYLASLLEKSRLRIERATRRMSREKKIEYLKRELERESVELSDKEREDAMNQAKAELDADLKREWIANAT
jgi:hypothetical protein